MRQCGCGFTRREVLRAGSLAAAGLVAEAKLRAQAKKSPRIDIHAQVWTDDFLDLTQSYGNTDTTTQRGKGAGLGQAEMDKRFALMEANGVEMQILSICPQAPHFDKKEHAVNAARKANDLYAEVVNRWPKKFKAFAAVPLPHVDEALKELDRALGQLKFVGATITTFIGNRSVADPAFSAFYEELNRRGTVLYIHSIRQRSEFPVYFPLSPDLGDRSAHRRYRFGNALDRGGHSATLPEAENRQLSSGRDDSHGISAPRQHHRVGAPNAGKNPHTAARRMWYDRRGARGHAPALKAAVDSLGADRIVLGSDYPYEGGELFDRAMAYIREAGLKSEDARKIMDRNAAAVLGFV